MKTIQTYFKEANVDELILQYRFRHPITIDPSSSYDCNLSISELIEIQESKLINLIDHIKTCDINESDDIWIFFAYYDINDDIDFAYVKQSELLDSNKRTDYYGYEFSKIEDTAGSYVADTPLTMYFLEELLIDYMFESSFFGYEQEYLQEALDDLTIKSDYLNNHVDDTEICSEPPLFEGPPKDKKQVELWFDFVQEQIKYASKLSRIEEQKVIELIIEDSR